MRRGPNLLEIRLDSSLQHKYFSIFVACNPHLISFLEMPSLSIQGKLYYSRIHSMPPGFLCSNTNCCVMALSAGILDSSVPDWHFQIHACVSHATATRT